ncbi:MAG TPA: hypothetical protein VLT89_04985 [Usitatibacter sp.]|nr:hypothetical protein [Usitatibacter sp.]
MQRVGLILFCFLFGIGVARQSSADVSISGSISNTAGTPLCALVLANGQFMFSCSPVGQYSLTVPLDANGQITLFGFADGHFPYKQIVAGSAGRVDMRLTVAQSSPPPANTNLSRTQQLLGGRWSFVYTIISTFTDTFSFTSVLSTPDSSGRYYAAGTDQFGKVVAGGYDPVTGLWGVLDQGIIIDQFYTFTFSDNNHVSGCYYQINPPGSTNFSRCYTLAGFRTPAQAAAAKSAADLRVHEEALRREVESDGQPPPPDPQAVEAYLALRRAAGPQSR